MSDTQKSEGIVAVRVTAFKPRRRHSTGQPGSHAFADRGLDSYPTTAVATRALFSVVDFAGRKPWDPFAGQGGVGGVLRDEFGVPSVCSDIVERDFKLDFVGDFFAQTAVPPGCDMVIGNPPFRRAADCIRHALTLVPEVIVLERLAFLEAARRDDLFRLGSGWSDVWAFARRLPMMHRTGWTGKRASSSMAFAWYRWRREYRGPPTIGRI